MKWNTTNVKQFGIWGYRVLIKPEHLTLIRRMNWWWDDSEYGAPAVDSKRPYGNSGVLGDLRELLGDGYSDDQLEELHRELEVVMQVCTSRMAFEAGEFQHPDVSDSCGGQWEKVEQLVSDEENFDVRR